MKMTKMMGTLMMRTMRWKTDIELLKMRQTC